MGLPNPPVAARPVTLRTPTIATFAALLTLLLPGSSQPQPAELVENYAESVMVVGISDDGSTELSVRVARFPPRAEGELWVTVSAGGHVYSFSQGGLTLADDGATPVAGDQVRFAVTGASSATLAASDRNGPSMRATLTGTANTHAALHPPPGAGPEPLSFEASFVAEHEGIRVRPGRLEVFGRLRATMETPGGTFTLDAPAKWHEQTGPRPRFAGTFTYFAAQNETTAILARGRGGIEWGYVREGDQITRVRSVRFDPLGREPRSFLLELENGRTVRGRATVLRQGSMPIEGQRRPGATVLVESSVGRMVGHLNDWDPEPAE